MPENTTKRPWEQRLHEAAATAEEELRRVMTYINDEVVPEVRLNGSQALRSAAAELERLARRMDDRAPPRAGNVSTPEDPSRR